MLGLLPIRCIPVPALEGMTWPLAWRYPPTGADRFVRTLLLRTALQDPVVHAGGAGRVS